MNNKYGLTLLDSQNQEYVRIDYVLSVEDQCKEAKRLLQEALKLFEGSIYENHIYFLIKNREKSQDLGIEI